MFLPGGETEFEMKRKIFGVFVMAVGCVMIAVGVTLMASASDSVEKPQNVAVEDIKEIDLTGTYVNTGDSEDKIVINGGTILIDGKESTCELKIWKDIPKTDEATGKITLYDYYYIQAGDIRYSYNVYAKSLSLNGQTYALEM